MELVEIRLALAKQGILRSWQGELEIASRNLVLESGTAKDYDAVAEILIDHDVHSFGIEYERTATRCIFTSFAEDVKLLPEKSWLRLLESLRDADNVAVFPEMASSLWQTMNTGGFSPILREKVLQFNGGLFESTHALPLSPDQLNLLIEAADSNWRDVDLLCIRVQRGLHVKELSAGRLPHLSPALGMVPPGAKRLIVARGLPKHRMEGRDSTGRLLPMGERDRVCRRLHAIQASQ
jgi:hypothetical protein